MRAASAVAAALALGLVMRALGWDAIVLLLTLSAILVGAAQQTLP